MIGVFGLLLMFSLGMAFFAIAVLTRNVFRQVGRPWTMQRIDLDNFGLAMILCMALTCMTVGVAGLAILEVLRWA